MPPSASAASTSMPLSGPTKKRSPAERSTIGPARPAHARVDHRQVHGAVRHVARRVAQHEGGAEQVVAGDAVGDVDDAHVRREARR